VSTAPLKLNVQIFGVKNSQATRAAERFFKERRIPFQLVDLSKKPMALAEIKRFIDRFGLPAILDTEGKSWIDAGLKYLKVSDSEMLGRIERDPKLLRLPLVRGGKHLSFGHDEEAWKLMLQST
jgi:arsenate reductase (glutaredoxin)